jgi:hypothetical protein
LYPAGQFDSHRDGRVGESALGRSVAEAGDAIAQRQDIAAAAAVELAAEAAPVLVNIEIMRAFVELRRGRGFSSSVG